MSRNRLLTTMGLLITLGGLGLESATAPAAPAGEPNPSPQAVQTAPGVIKAETNLVLVDVIATDKKGNYIKDLEKKDFHVSEDGTEQPIASFSRESDIEPNAPGHQRYMVLFFDDSTMSANLQIQARQAAGKFVESTASPNRMMAVVDFNGTLNIAQNFTADGDLLKKVVSTVKYSSVHPNGGVQVASMGAPSLAQTESDFAARSVLLSMREMAKALHAVPGRKTLILFSSGFPLTPDRQSELTATIDALNKANIAVYPVDVRGLAVTGVPGMDISNPAARDRVSDFRRVRNCVVLNRPSPTCRDFGRLWRPLAIPSLSGVVQAEVRAVLEAAVRVTGWAGGTGGTGGTGGSGSGGSKGGSGVTTGSGSGSGSGSTGGTKGGTGSGSTSGSRSGGSTNSPNNFNNSYANCMNVNTLGGVQNPNCPNRQIIPSIPDSVSTNQQVLYALAKGTGGFEIFNTNDFLSGLEKVSKEMNEYYNLGYSSPNRAHDGSYHKISVSVERQGVSAALSHGLFRRQEP